MLNRTVMEFVVLWVAGLVACAPAYADLNEEIKGLQHRWEEVNYQLEGKVQLSEFATLVNKAEAITQHYPNEAAAWIWSGIIKSTYAGAKGGLGALKLAKASKADLEKALELDPNSQNGSAYTSLGTLYFKVPAWPLGFGNDELAEELLLKAIAINPKGIDSNYFYGSYLQDQGRYEEAEYYFTIAKNAPQRPDRPLADAGRQKEIALALTDVKKHLK